MEIHYLRDELKSPSDQVKVTGDEVLLKVWRDLPPDPNKDRIECTGYQWLLTGRGQRLGEGARAVFDRYPEIQKIRLELLEYEFKSKGIDGRGKLKREEIVKPYLRMMLERKDLGNLESPSRSLKKAMFSNLQSCLEVGRQFVKSKEILL